MEITKQEEMAYKILGILSSNFKDTKTFTDAVISETNKLKTTGERINLVKRAIIDLKTKQISSSDYTLAWKIRDLNDVLLKLEEIKRLEVGLPDIKEIPASFAIKGKLSEPEIERYFMQLTGIHADYPDSKKDRICVLTPAQVKALLNGLGNKQKYVTPNFSQQQLRVFMYRFKSLHASKANSVMDFVKFEIEHFEVFSGLTEDVEYTNFNKGNVRLSPPYDTF